MIKFRQRSRRLLTALLACQLLVAAPVQAQPANAAPEAAALTAQAMPAHCAGHALQQAAPALHPAATAGAGQHHQGCCGQSDCAMGGCGGHCAGSVALTATRLEGSALALAEPASLLLAEPRVDRRAFEFFRPPI